MYVASQHHDKNPLSVLPLILFIKAVIQIFEIILVAEEGFFSFALLIEPFTPGWYGGAFIFLIGKLLEAGQQLLVSTKTSILEGAAVEIAQVEKLNLAAQPPGRICCPGLNLFLFHGMLLHIKKSTTSVQQLTGLFHIIPAADVNR